MDVKKLDSYEMYVMANDFVIARGASEKVLDQIARIGEQKINDVLSDDDRDFLVDLIETASDIGFYD